MSFREPHSCGSSSGHVIYAAGKDTPETEEGKPQFRTGTVSLEALIAQRYTGGTIGIASTMLAQ